MRELPVLFSGPMVRAILEGRKTVTRRVVNRVASLGPVTEFGKSNTPGYSWHCRDRRALWNDLRDDELLARCPYGQPGARLWVRETWAEVGSLDSGIVTYRATYPHDLPPGMDNVPADIHDAGYRWKPSIHMPRWASRITLEVTAVRVERLHAISDAQAWAEGVLLYEGGALDCCAGDWHQGLSASGSFATLWESISGAGSWSANPWVWVVEFKRIEKAMSNG